MLTATDRSSPSRSQIAACRVAASITQRVIGVTSAVVSASATNSPGETGPSCGWVQRSSASTLVQAPDSSITFGW